jgi:hypothetical protein
MRISSLAGQQQPCCLERRVASVLIHSLLYVSRTHLGSSMENRSSIGQLGEQHRAYAVAAASFTISRL